MADTDRQKMRDELELLQLEEARANAQRMRDRRASRKARMEKIELSLAQTRRSQENEQSICKHKKGGKGRENMLNGNDNNYAVITHTLSHGPVVVICQRCGKKWEPPPANLIRKGASADERKEYKRLYEEYVWARNLPTDNVPSGTQIFAITPAA
jgi:hypothetical protein